MPRATLSTLEALAQEAVEAGETFERMLMVCAGTGCVAANSLPVRDALVEALESRQLADTVRVVATGCNGFCAHGPICVVQPDGVFYEKLSARDAEELVEEHLIGGRPVERLMFHDEGSDKPVPLEKDIEFFAKQQTIALRNRGRIDPEDISDALAHGAYQALAKLMREKNGRDEIIDEMVRSGLRGRGGGGFPTGLKWRSCAEAVRERGEKPYVVCNGDEGDPGAFMDRSIVEADPHAVIEGLCIGAYALGAREGFVYIRREYPLALSGCAGRWSRPASGACWARASWAPTSPSTSPSTAAPAPSSAASPPP